MTGPYGITEIRFWRDPEVKRPLRPFDKLVLNYLFSAPNSNMSGVFYCPPATITDETGVPVDLVRRMLGQEGASDAPSDAPSAWAAPNLGSLTRWVTFDPETDEVFVHNLARKRVGKDLGAKDKRRPMVERFMAAIQSRTLLRLFTERYAAWALSTAPPDDSIPVEAAPEDARKEKGHRKGHPMGDRKGHATNREQRTENNPPPPPSDAKASGAPGGAAAVENTEWEEVPEPTRRSPLGQLAGTIRKVWWAPDGEPPAEWTMGRELGAWKRLGHQDVELCIQAIHGAQRLREQGGTWWRSDPRDYADLSWMQDEKLTAKIFINAYAGAVPIWQIALDAYDREPPPAKKPGPVGRDTRTPKLQPAGHGR